jgi:hypothetical protein
MPRHRARHGHQDERAGGDQRKEQTRLHLNPFP